GAAIVLAAAGATIGPGAAVAAANCVANPICLTELSITLGELAAGDALAGTTLAVSVAAPTGALILRKGDKILGAVDAATGKVVKLSEDTVVLLKTETKVSSSTATRVLTDAEKAGILREASNLPSGNRTLAGAATRAEADELGEAWVGPRYRLASDGQTLVSADGLRQYRPPSSKPSSPYSQTGVQANFERRVEINGRWQIESNAHLDIKD
ncbi:hypothetical protein CQ054_22655, partial [Ochrobactrum sp. MYb29]